MTEGCEPTKTVGDLIEQFKALAAQADAIRKQMAELTRQIEAHAGPDGPLVRKLNLAIDIPDSQ